MNFEDYINYFSNNFSNFNTYGLNKVKYDNDQQPHIIKYKKNIDNILSELNSIKPITSINNENEMFEKIKIVSKSLFNNISKLNYPTNDNRGNHGSGNHMRSLSYAIYIYKNFNILYPSNFNKTDYIQLFCLIISTYFVAIGRIGEGNRDYGNRQLKMNNFAIDYLYPNIKNEIKTFPDYGQNLHQFVSSFILLSIMKKILNSTYHSLIERCAFSITWYNKDHIRVSPSNYNNLFYHYFISTPHYIDHCRGPWSENMCHDIPMTLFNEYTKFINDIDKKNKIINLYKFVFSNLNKTGYKGYSNSITDKNIEDDISNFLINSNKHICYNQCGKLNNTNLPNNLFDFDKTWNDLIKSLIPVSASVSAYTAPPPAYTKPVSKPVSTPVSAYTSPQQSIKKIKVYIPQLIKNSSSYSVTNNPSAIKKINNILCFNYNIYNKFNSLILIGSLNKIDINDSNIKHLNNYNYEINESIVNKDIDVKIESINIDKFTNKTINFSNLYIPETNTHIGHINTNTTFTFIRGGQSYSIITINYNDIYKGVYVGNKNIGYNKVNNPTAPSVLCYNKNSIIQDIFGPTNALGTINNNTSIIKSNDIINSSTKVYVKINEIKEIPSVSGGRKTKSNNRKTKSNNRKTKSNNRKTKSNNRKTKSNNRRTKSNNRKTKSNNRKTKSKNRKTKSNNRKTKSNNRRTKYKI